MYLINQRSTVFNKFNSKLCMKQILSKKKKICAQRCSQKKNSCTGNRPKKKILASQKFPTPPPPITFLMVHPLCHIFCLFVFLCKFRLITFVVKKIYSFGIFEFRLDEAKIVWDIFFEVFEVTRTDCYRRTRLLFWISRENHEIGH